MNKNQLIQFLKQNDIWAKRTMGQNFLVDDEVLARIVAVSDLKPTDTVVEIGPGLGVLTEELAKRAGKVIAIEKDERLAEVLEARAINNELWKKKIKIINQDALKIHYSQFIIHNSSYKVVANIPYNITSPIIRKFLEAENQPELMVLLVQKEVAERITAKPGEMSLLSVAVQFYADAEIIDIVKNSSFFPVPKVDSAIIKLTPLHHGFAGRVADEKSFFRLVKFGFASRRKTLENNLAAGLQISKKVASDIIKKAGLPEKVRAQELSVKNWLEIFKIGGVDGGGKREIS